ncbi:MAG: hypothetical protein L0H10_05985 [Comamonas sp.]|uniref:hypothetical protein n=1 Tax=Comamonas sp. TaxID=34028 RepID=UPI002649539D|nr:hypothetical protein [Comamonas sp.]MDN5503355.1 hypothetical protein [Comamonas sp.]MDN5536853.1 hypothetical protein [Comamonas sp.]
MSITPPIFHSDLVRQHREALIEAKSSEKSNILDFPDRIFPHIRYLSNFQSNRVEISVGHKSDPEASTRIFNLDSIRIACLKGPGIYDTPQPLSHFPNLVTAAKLVINVACERYNDGETSAGISQELRVFQQTCSWMLSRGVYQLQDLTFHDVDTLARDLAERSWRGVLRYNRLFALLIKEVNDKPSIAAHLISSGHSKYPGLSTSTLEHHIGIPLHTTFIPNRLRRVIVKAVGMEFRPASYFQIIPSASELKFTMHALNSVALLPDGMDGFRFLPFPEPHKRRKELLPPEKAKRLAAGKTTFKSRMRAAGQTPNISTADYARAFEIFLKYTIDYGPAVCELMEIAREGVDALSKSGSGKTIRSVYKQVASQSVGLALAGRLPWQVVASGKGQHSLPDLIKMTLSAAGGLIAINHGRRQNEIVGENKPYGLYFGCLEELRSFPPAHQIDVYIEKGIQDFRSFPANSLVRDAVLLLERMYTLMRAKNENIPVYSMPRSLSRHRKLFEFRSFTRGLFREKLDAFDLRPYQTRLLNDAGIDATAWEGQQMPFRRAFATLLIRRYDLPEYPAAQAALGHFNLSTTIPYQSDRVARPHGTSIEELHGREVVASEVALVFEELAICRSEYLKDSVRRLLDGEFIGGKFASLVLSLVKRLSGNADFAQLSLDRKATQIASQLSGRGYAPETMRHNACMAGHARHTRAASNCQLDGKLHKEDATGEKCSGCIHSWTNDNYLKALQDDLALCEAGAGDSEQDARTRAEFLASAATIRKVLESEAELAESNRRKLAVFAESWQKMILRTRGENENL